MSALAVIDCSAAMSWCFADETTPASAQLLDSLATASAVVPDLWFLEVANVLSVAERRKRITTAQSDEFLRLLTGLDLDVDATAGDRAFDHLLPLCRQHQLSSYDAVYLDLAQRRGLPLATMDKGLRAAAKACGVRCYLA